MFGVVLQTLPLRKYKQVVTLVIGAFEAFVVYWLREFSRLILHVRICFSKLHAYSQT
jgi:hypothetical protein